MNKFFITWRSSKSLTILVCIFLTAVTVSALGVRRWYTLPAASPSPLPSAVQPTPTEQLQTELITVTSRGFEPAQITRPAGKFLLSITNRSEIRSITVRLTNESEQTLREKQLSGGKLSWREVVDLPPGSYWLTEANHPEWICQLTLTAN